MWHIDELEKRLYDIDRKQLPVPITLFKVESRLFHCFLMSVTFRVSGGGNGKGNEKKNCKHFKTFPWSAPINNFSVSNFAFKDNLSTISSHHPSHFQCFCSFLWCKVTDLWCCACIIPISYHSVLELHFHTNILWKQVGKIRKIMIRILAWRTIYKRIWIHV